MYSRALVNLKLDWLEGPENLIINNRKKCWLVVNSGVINVLHMI